MMKSYELASALRLEISKMYKTLRSQSHIDGNLSITESTIMSHLYFNGSLYPSEMAAIVRVKAQSVSQIITKLDENGLIVKVPSKTDKRKVAIFLSDKGKEEVEKSRHMRDSWLAKAIEQSLTHQEQQILQEAVMLLDKLSDIR